MTFETLSALEARIVAVLVEKQATVPDTYPLSLNSLVAGCNQKTAREPVMAVAESDVLSAIDDLKRRSLVIEVSRQPGGAPTNTTWAACWASPAICRAAQHLDAARAADRGGVARPQRAAAPLCRRLVGRRLSWTELAGRTPPKAVKLGPAARRA